MKVFGCPQELPSPQVDYKNYDSAKVEHDEQQHLQQLKAHMIGLGYNGQRTGEIIRFGVADGQAQYLLADAGAKSVLIHLPYGDAYQYPDVQFLPCKEILHRLDQQKSLDEMFSKRGPLVTA